MASVASIGDVMKPYFETHPIAWVWIVVAVAALVIAVSGALRRREEATKETGAA